MSQKSSIILSTSVRPHRVNMTLLCCIDIQYSNVVFPTKIYKKITINDLYIHFLYLMPADTRISNTSNYCGITTLRLGLYHWFVRDSRGGAFGIHCVYAYRTLYTYSILGTDLVLPSVPSSHATRRDLRVGGSRNEYHSHWFFRFIRFKERSVFIFIYFIVFLQTLSFGFDD